MAAQGYQQAQLGTHAQRQALHAAQMQHLQHRRTAALTSDIAAEIADLARRQMATRRTSY